MFSAVKISNSPGAFLTSAGAIRIRGYLIIVVTNQAGIAKGLYSETDFLKLTSWMVKQFEEQGIKISKVYHCPHHPDFTGSMRMQETQSGNDPAGNKRL